MSGEFDPTVYAAHRAERDLVALKAPVAGLLVLAALARAEVQEHREHGVLIGDLASHLGYRRSATASRFLKESLTGPIGAGLVKQVRAHGIEHWRLTRKGQRTLADARRDDKAPALPESPQHRRWRHSRELAGEQAAPLREQLQALCEQALAMLANTSGEVTSGAWFDLTERLYASCWGYGEVIYTLCEWPRPRAEHPDPAAFLYVADAIEGRPNGPHPRRRRPPQA